MVQKIIIENSDLKDGCYISPSSLEGFDGDIIINVSGVCSFGALKVSGNIIANNHAMLVAKSIHAGGTIDFSAGSSLYVEGEVSAGGKIKCFGITASSGIKAGGDIIVDTSIEAGREIIAGGKISSTLIKVTRGEDFEGLKFANIKTAGNITASIIQTDRSISCGGVLHAFNKVIVGLDLYETNHGPAQVICRAFDGGSVLNGILLSRLSYIGYIADSSEGKLYLEEQFSDFNKIIRAVDKQKFQEQKDVVTNLVGPFWAFDNHIIQVLVQDELIEKVRFEIIHYVNYLKNPWFD